jgi:hypothetical protein
MPVSERLISRPFDAYNSDAEDNKYSSSTIFVDVTGPLDGANYTDFNATAAGTGADAQAAQVTKAVKAGFLVRASADWNVSPPPRPPSNPPTPICPHPPLPGPKQIYSLNCVTT